MTNDNSDGSNNIIAIDNNYNISCRNKQPNSQKNAYHVANFGDKSEYHNVPFGLVVSSTIMDRQLPPKCIMVRTIYFNFQFFCMCVCMFLSFGLQERKLHVTFNFFGGTLKAQTITTATTWQLSSLLSSKLLLFFMFGIFFLVAGHRQTWLKTKRQLDYCSITTQCLETVP